MAKFKSGDIIKYEGRTLRVRMEAFVGFESDAHKPAQFYDLTDIDTGEHLSLPKLLVEQGIGEVENEDLDKPKYEEAKVSEPATFVEHSDKTYWEQMEGKIKVTDEVRKLWNRLTDRG